MVSTVNDEAVEVHEARHGDSDGMEGRDSDGLDDTLSDAGDKCQQELLEGHRVDRVNDGRVAGEMEGVSVEVLLLVATFVRAKP